MAIAAPPSTAISAGSPEVRAFSPQLDKMSPTRPLLENPDDRGRESEENVMKALGVLPIVESLTRHERYSPEDSNGTDITLILREDFLRQERLLRRVILIQVKSRDGNMDKFYHGQDKKRIAENSPLSLDEYIAAQGIMVLNGRHESEIIVEKFLVKLAFIQEVTERGRKPSAQPVVVFVEEPKIDIGQLAFSGTAKPSDATEWIKQNPQ